MAGNYDTLFTLPVNLYAEGSPLVIAAGKLLKENATGRVLAQLKLQNISAKAVKAARVRFHELDTAGLSLGCVTEREYLDFLARQGEEFGQKIPALFTNPTARSFTVEITRVVFEDNSIWEGTEAAWEPLPAPVPLETALGDSELVKQYRFRFGDKAVCLPEARKDLWLCACGALHRNEVKACFRCGQGRDALLGCDLEKLNAEKEQRLAREREAQEAARIAEEKAAAEKRAAEEKAAEEKKAAAEARAKKIKKLLFIGIPAVILCVAAFLLTTKVLIPSSRYNKAVALMEAEQYEEAIVIFDALDGYKDSEQQIEAAKLGIAEREQEAANAAAYEAAEALLASGDYKAAREAFLELGEYRDSAQRAEEAQEQKNEADYQKALSLLNAGKYEEAIAAFDALGGYKDSASQSKKATDLFHEEQYQHALTLAEEGEYEKAIAAFKALGSYKDAKDQIQVTKDLMLANASVGDTVYFGSYEQDNNTANGKEDIEWLVLDKQNGRLLVISKYVLDCQKYWYGLKSITWAESSLRTWLNEEFFNQAFTEEEQKKIPTVTVSADWNPQYESSKYANPGNATQDKVYVLSVKEVQKYFGEKNSWTSESTNYAMARGMKSNYCAWWTRTPGDGSLYVSLVSNDLGIFYSGHYPNYEGIGVRPVIWITVG